MPLKYEGGQILMYINRKYLSKNKKNFLILLLSLENLVFENINNLPILIEKNDEIKTEFCIM